MKYTIHTRASDTNFVFYGDVVFRPENYGRFDYVILQEKDVLNIYLSEVGLKEARAYGLKFLNKEWRKNKLALLNNQLKTLRAAAHKKDVAKLHPENHLAHLEVYEKHVSKLARAYLLLEAPTLVGIEELATKNKSLKKLIERLGRFKYDIHVASADPGIIGDLATFITNLGQQFKVNFEDVMNMRISEVKSFIKSGKVRNIKSIQARREGFIYIPRKDKIVVGKSYEKWKNKLEPPHKGDIHGTISNKGIARGKVVVHLSGAFGREIPKGTVLVSGMTNPQMMPYLKNAVALVTDEGGMMSHAAIISREMRIPCITGTRNASRVLKDGDEVLVDANNGVIKLLKRVK